MTVKGGGDYEPVISVRHASPPPPPLPLRDAQPQSDRLTWKSDFYFYIRNRLVIWLCGARSGRPRKPKRKLAKADFELF